ncbi:MAG: porin [Rhodobacteraceae bacterium]|nr:porin [Paracoccaceae bacterium]
MKKLLLASTALVMTAGVAAAEVALSGNARMGFIYDGNDVQLTSRARVTFTLSGETDGGLAFGARFDADDADTAAGEERMTDGTVFISGEFGTLTFGDTSSAARAATGDLYGVGLTGLDDQNEMNYLDRVMFTDEIGGLTNGGLDVSAATFSGSVVSEQNYDTSALYAYTIDGFSGFIGLSQNNQSGADSQIMVSLGGAYTWEGLTAALGAELVRTEVGALSFDSNHVTASLEYEMDMFSAKAFVGRVGGDLGTLLDANPDYSKTHGGVSVQGSFDATTVTAFVRRDVFGNTDAGLGMGYDLGGGATFRAGIVRDETYNTATSLYQRETIADLGLAFTF